MLSFILPMSMAIRSRRPGNGIIYMTTCTATTLTRTYGTMKFMNCLQHQNNYCTSIILSPFRIVHIRRSYDWQSCPKTVWFCRRDHEDFDTVPVCRFCSAALHCTHHIGCSSPAN